MSATKPTHEAGTVGKIALTEDHKHSIDAARNEWLAVGLSTEPANFDAAQAAITKLYEYANLKRPHFVRLSSPLAAELYINLLCKTWPDVTKDQLRDQLWDQLGDQLRDQLRDQLGDQLGDQLQFMGTWFYGAWDYYWAWLEGGRRVGAIYSEAQNTALDAHLAIMRSCGWWYPFDDFCIVTDRPSTIMRDDQGRLHSENGMALQYRDGTGLSAWHGIRVPHRWIAKKDALDPSEVIGAQNVEQRAAGAAIIGWPKMLSVLNARTIDRHVNPDVGELIELTLPGLDEPGRFLKAQCPRNGLIVEGVPRVSDIDGLPIETALHAQAWRVGDPLSEYVHPPKRT